MKKLFNHNGFTLIEMIIVISIISLLSTVGMNSYNTVLRNARDTKRKADLHEFVNAIKLFQVHNNRGPSETSWCQSSIGTDPNHGCPPDTITGQWARDATWTDLVTGGYLEELPVDPLNNATYHYYYEPNNPAPNLGGWVRARLESTNAYYYVYWEAP